MFKKGESLPFPSSGWAFLLRGRVGERKDVRQNLLSFRKVEVLANGRVDVDVKSGLIGTSFWKGKVIMKCAW